MSSWRVKNEDLEVKNNYLNKQAPVKEVAKKYLKTEIVQHILIGKVLNENGTLVASNNVFQETIKMKSLNRLLGMEIQCILLGKASLIHYSFVKEKSQSFKTNT